MTRKLTLIEGLLIFAAVCGALYLLSNPVLVTRGQWWSLIGQAGAFSLCCMITFYYNDLYDLRIVHSPGELGRRIFRSFGILALLLAGFAFLFPRNGFAAGPLASSLLFIGGILVSFRALSHGVMRKPSFTKRAVILGMGPLARKVIKEMAARSHFGYAVIGVVDDSVTAVEPPFRSSPPLLEQPGCPFFGPLKNLSRIVDEVAPDCIIVALPERLQRWNVREALLEARARGIIIEDAAEIYERLTGKLAIEWLTPQRLIFSRGFRRSGLDLALARGLSLLFAALGLILLAPLFALIALAIKLDSRGPVFFAQDRAGMHGKSFRLIKFRTMHPANGKTSEWVRDNEDRITRVGRWLRKFRLDELPQFIHILKGDMNLVGPRPHPVSNYEMFILVSRNTPECGEPIPYYSLRSMVRPGITGWAQIQYRYANGLGEEMEKMCYDLYYVKHMSFWFDLWILLDTVKVVALGRGAQTTDAYGIGAPMSADAH